MTPQDPHDSPSRPDDRAEGPLGEPEPLTPGETPVCDEDQEQLTVVPSTAQAALPRDRLTPDGRFKSGRLAGLTLGPALWILSWPIITESFLNSLVGLVDTMLAAGLPDGEAATDAIGGASYIMWLIGLVVMALGIGATALVSRSVGKSRMAVAGTVVGQTATLAIVAGVAVGAVIFLAAPLVVDTLKMSEDAAGYFRDYMRVIALGVPSATMLFGMIACARGAGDSISPLTAMVVRNLVNIGVSWCASGASVFGNAPPVSLDLGVTGIAIGTVAGDVAGMLVVLHQARSGQWGVRLRLRRMRPHWITVRRIVRLGVPNFFETLGMWLGNFFIVAFVGSLALQTGREGLLGAHIIAIRIEAFSFLAGFAMGSAAATLAGQYLGARRPDLAKRAVLIAAGVATAMMAAFGLAFILLPRPITSLLSEQPAHLELVPPLLVICGCVQIPFALAIVLRSAMRGAGDAKAVMVITWTTTYAVRLPLAYFISGVDVTLPGFLGGATVVNPVPWEGSLTLLWIGICSELVIRGAAFTGYFLKGRWLNVKV
jgi:putative MATE family efflux protein